jgi:hypothetical protein
MSIDPRTRFPSPTLMSRRTPALAIQPDGSRSVAESIADAWRRESAEVKAHWRAADDHAQHQRARTMGYRARM